MRHLVAISDIHLSEVEPGSGLWMRYRQKAFTPGAEIAAMLEQLISRVRGDDLTVVLNGDVFDLDAPHVTGGESLHHDKPRDAAHAAPAVAAILRDHPEFVAGLARVLAEGHRLVFVSGNHDVQLTLPEARDVVRDVVIGAAMEMCSASREELSRRVEFRAWFYRTEEGVIFEHGHQYDTFCSFRYPMAPFGKTPGVIQPTLGSMTARLYMGRLGYFNPHVDATFMLDLPGYLQHWLKYYVFTKRSQGWIWFSGAVRALHAIATHRDVGSRKRHRDNIASAAAETGASFRAVARHARLFAQPGEDLLWLCARELWLDRVVFAGLAASALGAWALSQRHAFGVLATVGPVALFAVEMAQPKGSLEETWRKVQRRARQVAKVHKARAVVFGHTHTPEGVWEEGVFYGNTGSWSAAYRDVACTEPLFDERPLVWLTADGEKLSGGLCSWKKGTFRFK